MTLAQLGQTDPFLGFLLVVIPFMIFVYFMRIFIAASLTAVIGYAFWITRPFWIALAWTWWNVSKLFAIGLIGVTISSLVFGEHRPLQYLLMLGYLVFVHVPLMVFGYIAGL